MFEVSLGSEGELLVSAAVVRRVTVMSGRQVDGDEVVLLALELEGSSGRIALPMVVARAVALDLARCSGIGVGRRGGE